MGRPYKSSSIDRLEEEFRAHRGNAAVLNELSHELSHRTTKRAAKLRATVTAALRGVEPRPTPAAAPRTARPSPVSTDTPVPVMDRTPSLIHPPLPPPTPEAPPPTSNRPQDLLAGWTALEVLSPATYVRPEDLAGGERSRVIPVGGRSLPWLAGRRSRPGRRLYYQVVLGSVRVEAAVARLLERYGDSRPERPAPRGRAVLAAVVLDSRGVPVAGPAVAVSSFGWGVMTALTGNLGDLAGWPAVERTLTDVLDAAVRRPAQAAGEPPPDRPVDWATLERAYTTVVRAVGLPEDLVEPPAFAVCSYTHFRNPDPPEPLLLNSFFLGDLAEARRLVAAGRTPPVLAAYLGQTPPPAKQDLLTDAGAVRQAVSPGRTPPARWPGRHPLCLMQQAAANLAAALPEGGVLGVNGPPGTGKTTLLRDMVAHSVAARAEALCRFDDPADAFTHSRERIRAGTDGGAWLHLYRLSPDLRGFELVVASSNNKAVENVSAELPAAESVADGPRHYKALADALHGRPTWGLAAAVLGNQANLSRFRSTFWWDEDVGMSRYLGAAASGAPPQVQERDAETGAVTYRPPKLVAEEPPPTTREEALARWREARDRFREALGRSREWRRRLEAVEADTLALPGLIAAERVAESRLSDATSVETTDREALAAARAAVGSGEAAVAAATDAAQAHLTGHPGWLARLFRRPRARAWRAEHDALAAALGAGEAALAAARASRDRAHDQHARAEADLRSRRGECDAARHARAAAEDRVADARAAGVVPVDVDFFHLPHTERQAATPWLPPAAQAARDGVFVAALDLHRAFLAAAAKPVRHNLGALMSVMGGRRLRPAQEALLGDLWSTLFLAVPLVSTTFASVERMLGRLPPEALGWLLVDEAGQAPPQAAVGALLRTRRALVVGDPVQIEPVVTLPDQLSRAVCVHSGVDPDRFAAPAASVQTLADAASAYESEFPTRGGTRAVGVPLLVHRRCAEPMFGLANAIAYAGLMVPAKGAGPSPIRDVFGPSAWVHVEGGGEDKWCEAEGAAVLGLLGRLAAAGAAPDLYVVTPFVVVAERLRRLVRESGLLDGWVPEDEGRRDWAAARIGTVHTAQGREAEAVILVLGAPEEGQTGAREWAGGRPNLLNVAATRAKEAIYVVGNRRLWREAGVFGSLDERMGSLPAPADPVPRDTPRQPAGTGSGGEVCVRESRPTAGDPQRTLFDDLDAC